MSLSFLPNDITVALSHLNEKFLTEIRIRKGLPVVVGYADEYIYLGKFGKSHSDNDKIYANSVDDILSKAVGGNIFNYTEQLKNGFITVEHGVRIGIAGEYVTEDGEINTIKCITSLNIRIPHEIFGCSEKIRRILFSDGIKSVLIFSKPGLGKTTILRDLALNIGKNKSETVLVFDERNEISAMDSYGDGFDLGMADVVRCHNKLHAISGAIRAMKPSVIITDELYGKMDEKAVQYAADCGIKVIASSHVTKKEILKDLPFEYFVELISLGEPVIYDKNFNIISDNNSHNLHGGSAGC